MIRELLPSSLRDATHSPFCRWRDIFPRPGEVFLKEGGFGSTAKFSSLPMAPSPRELANPQGLTEGVSTRKRFQKGCPMSLPYKGKLIPRAKELRKNATRQEKNLWYGFLNSYPVRFQRQKSIDSFVADFYCHEAKLVVELDGSQHYEEAGIARDKERSAILEKYGLKVIRFSNLEVDRNFQGVCTTIDLAVKERTKA